MSEKEILEYLIDSWKKKIDYNCPPDKIGSCHKCPIFNTICSQYKFRLQRDRREVISYYKSKYDIESKLKEFLEIL